MEIIAFEGLAGCVRERKRYQQTFKNDTPIHRKSMNNRCRSYARKCDAQVVGQNANMDTIFQIPLKL